MTDPRINEIRIDQPGTDTDEYFELIGMPGAPLDGLTYLVIGDSGSNGGVIEAEIDLTGQSFDADGLFVAAESTFLITAADFTTNLNFENSDNVTHLLVRGFNGAVGDDIDTNDDGTLDFEPWTEVVDSVALVETPNSGDPIYSTTTVGPDGSFVPAHVFRLPDGHGTFEIGDFAAGTTDRPGVANDGPPPPPPPPPTVDIFDIQGATHTSTYDGQTVKTGGVVTAVAFNGFYLQDPDGDGDIATSDGIFVQSRDTVTIGQVVEVTGTVNEVRGSGRTTDLTVTQLNATDVADLGTAALPQAVILGDGGRKPPSEVVDDDAFASFDPTTDAIDFYESLEGMLVTAQDTVAVGAIRQFGRFSAETFTLLDDGADATPVDARTERGGINLDSGPDNTGDQNPERVQIQFDGTLFGSTNYPEINVGDQLGDVTGVVGYSFGNYEVNIVGALNPDFEVVPGGNESETTELTGDAEHLTVASYNVLNLTSTLASGDPDAAQRTLLAEQIVNNLGSPDIIALQEIQDNDGTDGGTSSTVTDASQTLQDLVDAIDLADDGLLNGSRVYSYFDVAPEDDTSGGVPGGNIRNAFLYDADRVDLVGFESLTPDVLDEFDVDNPNAFDGTRDPLLATFRFNGEELTIINNHFTSRFGSSPVFGTEQPFVQAGEAEREGQAQALNEVVDEILDDEEDANVVVLGDLNTFEFTNDLAEILPGTGSDQILTNLVPGVDDDNIYSFIFEGNSQALDHFFVSDSLLAEAELDIVHTNVGFARCFVDTTASDHDPLLARLKLGENDDEDDDDDELFAFDGLSGGAHDHAWLLDLAGSDGGLSDDVLERLEDAGLDLGLLGVALEHDDVALV